MFMSFRLFARYILGSGFACDFLLPQNLRKVAKLTHGYSNGGPIHQNNASNEEAFPTRTYSNKLLYHHSCMSTRPGCILQCVYTCIYIFTLDIVYVQGERRESVYYFYMLQYRSRLKFGSLCVLHVKDISCISFIYFSQI